MSYKFLPLSAYVLHREFTGTSQDSNLNLPPRVQAEGFEPAYLRLMRPLHNPLCALLGWHPRPLAITAFHGSEAVLKAARVSPKSLLSPYVRLGIEYVV